MSSPSPDKSPTPADIFIDWLSRREQGSEQDFRNLLHEHAAHAAELKRIYAEWERALDALHRARAHGTAGDVSLSKRLQIRFGNDVDPHVSLRGTDERADSVSSAVIQRLSGRTSSFGRYQLKGEIARGGMGAILRIWDEDLRRHLAMKVILGQADAPSSTATPPVESSKVARFLEEAQVTGQLDHPGIVPVHELGLDPDGRVYFTMKLVKGHTLKYVFDLVSAGKEGWTQTKALGVLLKVCEAMAYAHDKGVIHRDLKPGNIMVGKFGEVHVMDWGLARILDKEDEKDIRIREEIPQGTSSLRTEREEHRGETPESPLYTMDGDVVGTPAYMPPEQAAGKVNEVGPHSDVYAMGAMLYHLIAGHMPYVPKDARLNNYAIWGLVQQGPPTSIAQLSPDTPAELVAICDKAMARDWKQRYRDMSELAADLSAYLEHRVVGAYQTGAWAETKKWVERNKPLAASLAAGVLLLAAGLVTSLLFKTRADQKAVEASEQAGIATQRASELLAANTTIQAANTALAAATKTALDNEKLANEQSAIATNKANDVLALSAIQELKELIERADLLWPALPNQVQAYDAWLADANVLVNGRPADPSKGMERHPSLKDHEAKLAEIRRRANASALAKVEPNGAGSISVDGASHNSTTVAQPENGADERHIYEFDDAQDRWWHAQLSQLVADLKAFTDEKTGLFSKGTSEQHGWGILRRRNEAATIEERSVSGADVKRLWDEAVAAIAKSRKYAGLRLPPQVGLIPIGEDPGSHLWEFAHLQTGDVPERGADGQLLLKESMGIVLVLIPAGKFWMGAQKNDPNGRNYDPQALADQSPVHEVELSAYFLSKYEMTQGQWVHVAARNPSYYRPGATFNGHQHGLLHPVENVTWDECTELLSRMDLSLPSEAQWENGCRARTDTAWWTGADRESLRGNVNLADQAFVRAGGFKPIADEWPDLDDGWVAHAPVGTFIANAFGLHEVHGNVWERCLDGYDSGAYSKYSSKDPIAPAIGASPRVDRGGSFNDSASKAGSASRLNGTPEYRTSLLGLRPAKAVRF